MCVRNGLQSSSLHDTFSTPPFGCVLCVPRYAVYPILVHSSSFGETHLPPKIVRGVFYVLCYVYLACYQVHGMRVGDE